MFFLIADKTFEDFRQELLGCKEADGKPSCRYGVFDLDFEFNGNPKKKLVFVSWYVLINTLSVFQLVLSLGYVINYGQNSDFQT